MAKEFAKAFYNSTQWKNCKEAYLRSTNYLCERCKAKGIIQPADIVHHKCYLTPLNISDSRVSLNFENLEALCQACHNAEHFKSAKRYSIDEFGQVKLK